MKVMADSIAPADRLPTPAELHAFLAKHYPQVRWLDPGQPAQCYDAVPTTSLPLSDDLVRELRPIIREDLARALERRWKAEQEKGNAGGEEPTVFNGSPEGSSPCSADLFLIASSTAEPWQRVRACMHMVGLEQTAAVELIDPKMDKGSMNEWVMGRVKEYACLEPLCVLLDINPRWVSRGVLLTEVFWHESCPWWLTPWWEADCQCVAFLDTMEKNGLLPFLADERPPRYDLLTFWQCWQQRPEKITLPASPPGSAPSMLSWLFACGQWYRMGNPAESITVTRESRAHLEWIIQFYESHGGDLLHGGTAAARPLPVGTPPTGEQVLLLKTWLGMPAEANPRLVTPSGQECRLTPHQAPAPEMLPSDVAREKVGKRRGRPPGAKNKKTTSGDAKRASGKKKR